MLKKLIYASITLFILSSAGAGADDIDQKIAVSKLLEKKCSQCHEADRANKMHASKDSFLDIVKKMVKKGAKINKQETEDIADFLGTPSRFIFSEQCTKCHGLDRIVDAHKKGTLTKDTLKKMQQKGAKVTEKQMESIWDLLNSSYFVAPMPPGNPGMR